MKGYLFTLVSLLLLTTTAHANFLDKVNSKIKAVESINNTADRAERATERSAKRAGARTDNKSDSKLFSEWKEDLKVAEKGAQKSCKKKIAFEFDPIRFKGFLNTNQSPGAMCGDIAKSLEFDLCTDNKYVGKVTKGIDKVKCYYTSRSDSSVKMRLNNKELLVGFSENAKDIYEESMVWLQNNL